MVGGQDHGLTLRVNPVRGRVAALGLAAAVALVELFVALVAVALDICAGTGGAAGQRRRYGLFHDGQCARNYRVPLPPYAPGGTCE